MALGTLAPGPATQYRQPRHAREYDHDRFGGSFGRFLESGEVELFLSLLDAGDGVILDAGAGTGKLTLPLLRAGRPVVAADFSAAMLTIARGKAEAEGLPHAFVVADVQAMGFADRSFAWTVSSRLLMHVPDWRAAVAELCRVTRHALVLDFPPSFGFARVESAWRRLRPAAARAGAHRGYRTFSPAEVAQELGRHGFEIVHERRGYLLPLRFHRWLERPRWSVRIERLLVRTGLVRRFGAPVTILGRRRRA